MDVQLKRTAYTLIELLIVVAIMAILVALSLVAVKRVTEGGRAREASRQLTAYFEMARARAVLINRPCGVSFKCVRPIGAGPTIRMATECTLAEYPPPFSGSTTSALAKVQEMPPGSNSHYFVIVGPQYPPQIDANEMAFLASIIPDGAMFLVKFGFGGEWHTFRRQGAQYPYVRPPTIGVLPPGFSNARAQGVLFQIRRMPERVGSPIELNRGIAVDLTYSGVGRTGQQFGAAQNSITILFNPGSDVEGIYIDNNAPLAATGTIYLLLGKIEKVGEVPPIDPVWVDKTIANISDSDALWVSIGARTGIPMTNDNMTNENVNPTGLSQYISATRTSATDRQRADAP